MTRVPTCQHCQDLRHKCYGIANRVCGRCQCKKKTFQDVVVKGESFCFPLCGYHADMMAVDSVLVAPRRVHPTVAPVKTLTQSKRVATRGKASPCPMTRPWAHKVTRIASPMPEAVALTTPVMGPSRPDHPTLFVDPIVLGDEGIGGSAPAMSGEL